MTVKELKEILSKMPENVNIDFGIITPDEYIPCEFDQMEYDSSEDVVDVYFTSKDIEELKELREEEDLNTVTIELIPDFKTE